MLIMSSDAFCNNKIGNDFIGPLSEVRFETGDPPKAYNCEVIRRISLAEGRSLLQARGYPIG